MSEAMGLPSTPESEAHSGLLLLIYQSVEAPELLPTTLSALAAFAGAATARIVRTTANDEQVMAGGSAREWQGAKAGAPRGEPAVGVRILPLSGDCELILEGCDPAAERLTRVVRMAPHLARALRLIDRLASRDGDPFAASEQLDLLSFGLLLLDGSKRSILINRAARTLLRPRSVLELCDGHLTPRAAVSRALLDTLLERAVARGHEQRRRAVGGRMSLGAAGQPPIDLVVAPFRVRCDGGESACAVLLFSRTIGDPDPESLFVRRLGLDAGDAAAAARLLAGRSPLAATDGGDLDGVRRSVQDLFERLGTTRQSDLLRLLFEASRSPEIARRLPG